MGNKIIGFIYDGSLEKRPKKLQNNVFVLYLPKRIKLRPEFMKLSVHMPELIIAACVLLPTLCKSGLCMESFQYISANNICNASQSINLLWKLHFELVNRILFLRYAKNRSSVSLLP